MLRNRQDTFGWGTIILHWAIALLIAGLLVSGYVMTRPDSDPALQFELYQWHKSFGFTALALSVLRILWRLANVHPEPVTGLSIFEKRASAVTHRLLVGLTVAVPMAGWALASTSTLNIPTFFFNRVVIPHLPMEKSIGAEAFWADTHALLAYGLASLVLLHGGAALHHHFVRRDKVLTRMLRSPWYRG